MGVANGTLRVRTMIVLSYPLATCVAVDLRRPPVFDLSLLKPQWRGTQPRADSKADLTACAIRADPCQDRSDAAVATTASRPARPASVLLWCVGSERGAARQSTTWQELPDPILTKPTLTLTGSPLRNPRTSKSADATRKPNGRSALSAARSVHISARIIRFTARANTLRTVRRGCNASSSDHDRLVLSPCDPCRC
jgi:hypothetical protein